MSRFHLFALLACVLALGGSELSLFGQPGEDPPAVTDQEAEGPEAQTPESTGNESEAPPPDDSAATAQQPADAPDSQESAPEDASDGEQPTMGSAPADGAPSEPPTGETDAASGPAEEPPSQPATREAAEGPTPPEAPVEAAEDDDRVPEGMNRWLVLGIVVALFVVPIWLGSLLAKRFRMADHGWRISLALGSIGAAAAVIALGWPPRGGPDLVGGITLIYEVDDTSRLQRQPGQNGVAFNAPTTGDVDVQELIGALSERINPAGTKEVTIREYGAGQVEIIVPKAGGDELEQLKNTITNLGELEFRIVASQRDPEHARVVAAAQDLGPHEKSVTIDGEEVARWVPYNAEEFAPVEALDKVAERLMLKRPGIDSRGNEVAETVVLLDEFDVTGEYLDTTWADRDETGRPAVSFRFDATGARLFGQLTGRNVPNPTTQQHRFLGILLNGELRSAPSINQRIQGQGIIEGDFSEEEVESLVNVLNAGSLPAALNPTPLSEQVISPTLGESTVRQGAVANLVSLLLVMAFMFVYYRFAGFVACVALVANLLLILGTMMLFKAAFTLPGLAGLVLTIGMSVDANVLIFERMREELARGAAFRMAIRNGFDKAKSAIFDSNITTILTGIILFWIGTDQIKGFATTLIIGIVMSLYTAVYLSRLIFDIAEKQGWVRGVQMMRIVGETKIDFFKLQVPAIAASCVVILIGLVAVAQRGRDMLNIDFTGGVSASMVLRQDAQLDQAEITRMLEDTPIGDRDLLVVEQTEVADVAGPRTKEFMVYARLDDEEVAELDPSGGNTTAVEFVQGILESTFGDRLETYSVDIRGVEPITDASAGIFAGGTQTTLFFGTKDNPQTPQPVAHSTVDERLRRILESTENGGQVGLTVSHSGYVSGSAERFAEWTVRMSLPPERAEGVLAQFKSEMDSSPLFPLANRIGGQVAGDMQKLAGLAIFFSLLCIVGYIWLRFEQVSWGVASVIALAHDVLVTIGMIAISAWVVSYLPPVATALQLEPFQISLQVVAALLTIVGYSINDTIVIFDRIREVRGKSPNLTREMINLSVNQTLGRTILTSLTVLIVVVVLYFFGGPGIHAFAFALVVGVLAGCYSTVFIASPALLWMNRPAKQE